MGLDLTWIKEFCLFLPKSVPICMFLFPEKKAACEEVRCIPYSSHREIFRKMRAGEILRNCISSSPGLRCYPGYMESVWGETLCRFPHVPIRRRRQRVALHTVETFGLLLIARKQCREGCNRSRMLPMQGRRSTVQITQGSSSLATLGFQGPNPVGMTSPVNPQNPFDSKILMPESTKSRSLREGAGR